MEPATFFAFWSVSLLFTLIPGPEWAFTIAAGLQGRVILPALGGLMGGHLVVILTVAAGLGTFFAQSPLAMGLLTAAGALYLLFLGTGLVRHPAEPVSAQDCGSGGSGKSGKGFWHGGTIWAARGAGVSGMNPKLYLLMFALLPQFVSGDISWSVPAQVLALGALHIASCFSVYLAVGLIAKATLATRPGAARLVSRCSGIIMVCLGVGMLAEQLQTVL